MDTKELIERYFNELNSGREWKSFLSEDLLFTSHVEPTKIVRGREAYLASTQRFFAMVQKVDVKTLLIDGDRASTLSTYRLQIPQGPTFESDVAEFFSVADGKIASLSICFDTSPYPRPNQN